MRSKPVSAETMEIGKKGGGKHWTDAEVSARKKAAQALKRKRVDLIAPEHLSSGALYIWTRRVSEAAEFGLLDNLDVGELATYCDLENQYQILSKRINDPDIESTDDDVKLLLSISRHKSNIAEHLGFTPSSRARLAKKLADRELADKFGDKFDR